MARGGALRAGAFVVSAVFSAGSAALLFRHLGKIDAGRYATALALVAIVAAACDLGLTGVGVRELSLREPADRWQLARDLLGLRLTLTTIAGVLVSLLAWLAYSPTLGAGVALASLGLLLLVTQDNAALSLLIGLRLGTVAALDLLRQLLTIALIVLLVLAGARIVPFLAIPIPVGVIVLAATVMLVRGTRPLAPTFDVGRWKRFTRPMLAYTAAIAASAVYLRVAVLLVSILASASQLGYFALGYRIVEVLAPIPGLAIGAALPLFTRAAENDYGRLGYALGRTHEAGVIAGAWVAVSFAVGAPLAVEVIGGAQFKGAVPVLAIEGVALGSMFVSLVWANGLLSLGRYREILAINLSALIVLAAVVAALVPLDGARGAAIGASVVEFALCFVTAAVAARARPELRVPLRIVGPVALASAAGLAPLSLAAAGVPVIVRLLLSTLLFAGTILALRAFPRELLDLLPARRRGSVPAP